MKATGYVRKIDKVGRIVLPTELRKALKIKKGDKLIINVINRDSIEIEKLNENDEKIKTDCS